MLTTIDWLILAVVAGCMGYVIVYVRALGAALRRLAAENPAEGPEWEPPEPDAPEPPPVDGDMWRDFLVDHAELLDLGLVDA